MRVIGGEYRSRRLKTPRGGAVRPTSDRLRQTLFNVLGPEVAGEVFVDAYAGSGAVGIEALSRGAARAVFIETDRRALAALRENLRALGLERKAVVIRRPAKTALETVVAGIVFLDPPYREVDEYGAALRSLAQSGARLVVVEHPTPMAVPESCGPLRRSRVVRQGDSSLSFYRPAESAG